MALETKAQLAGIKSVIGIVSGKGGTGKTFLAANIAVTLAKTGKRVGVLDADISCPDLFKILGITARLSPTADHKLTPIEKFGIKTISMAGLCGTPDEPIVWRGPILSRIIQQFLKESLWGELDFLLIDFPTGTSDASITILQNFHVDGALVVTSPQELALFDARRTIRGLELIRVPVIGIVENMRGEIFGEGGGMKLAEQFRVPFLGSIPMRKQITVLSDTGQPPVLHMEELEIIFMRMCRTITETLMPSPSL